MPSEWYGTGDEYDAYMNSPAPPSPGSELVFDPRRVKLEEPDTGGGTKRCAHCHRRMKRTKRNKKNIKT
jgi:hypothetical protein